MLRVFRIVALVLFALLASAPLKAADETPRQAIESARNALSEIETGLKSDGLTQSDLARLRSINEPLGSRIQAIASELAPRLESSRKRLAELKPQTKEQTGAVDPASAELQDEQVKFATLDADLRSARALLLQSDDIASRIGVARRELFARETFTRSSSVISPVLWLEIASEAPHDTTVILSSITDWARGLSARLTRAQALGFLAFVLALVAVTAPARWLALRVVARDPQFDQPTRLKRAVAAAWTAIVLLALPLTALGAIAFALDAFDISEPRLQSGFDGLLDGLRLIAVAYAFGISLFAPREPNWRMFSLGNRPAAILFRYLIITATVWGAEKLFEAVAEETASLNIAIASRALGALLIGLAGVVALRRIVDPKLISQAGRDPWAPARTLAWSFLALLLAAAFTGYIAFAAFLINQTLFVFAVGGALYLADTIVQESADWLLQPDTALGRGLITTVGLRRETVEQTIVVIQAFARVVALIAALVVAFGPLGLPAQDFFATLRAAYFGFTLGGVTVSLSSIFAAGVVFVLVVLTTRAVQTWLSERYLPRTRLDPSIGNSIRTITGYIGLVVALLVAGTRIGVDLHQFSLVAGALSVGIGFGLQGIVNNFVSGLILLWERGIRVGDWVVIGSDQGFVRKINARSTEIETFERATLIIPNFNLVTGSVKNWMHTDRVARLVVTLNVDFGTDPEAVRALMIAAAKAQDAVLTIPAPLALFSEIGDWALRFQLICFVDDALMTERVRSEINFDMHRRVREAGINIAAPYPRPK